MAKTAKDMIAAARARIENLSAEQVAASLAGALVVDLREAEELAKEGTLPGAVHVPRGLLEFAADPTSPAHRPGFDPAGRVILYCASGGRSALAAATLKDLGYDRVAHLDGGFKAWKDQGRPIERK